DGHDPSFAWRHAPFSAGAASAYHGFPWKWRPLSDRCAFGAVGARCRNYNLYRGISRTAFSRSIVCNSAVLNSPASRRPDAVAFAVRKGKSVPNRICVGVTSLVSEAKGWMVIALAVS